MNASARIEVPGRLTLPEVGFVIIGRNEGARLATCIASVLRVSGIAVYVDSGSVDGSSDMARGMGLPVVELDPAGGFTAARARNAGAAWMLTNRPSLEFIHFVDGDCELVSGWLPKAALWGVAPDE